MTATIAIDDAAPPRAARRLLTGFFVGLGVVMAVWGARMPAVQAAAHLGPGRLAVVLLAAAAGMVAGLQIGGRLAQRHGPARLLVAPAIVFGLSLGALGQCRSLTSLCVVAVAFGLAHGLLDVGVNAAAVQCQHEFGRSIMSGLHAAYSLGALAGAGLAAATTWVSHQVVFAAVAAAVALAAAAAWPKVRHIQALDQHPGSEEHSDSGGPKGLSRSTMWLLGSLAAACLLAEGAANDWAAVHLRHLDASESVAASAYAFYSAAMAAGRLLGDRFTARFGAVTVVRAGALIASAGLAAGLLANSAPAALAGWMALGLGLSTAVPSLITAAGRGGPRAVGTVAATGYIGLLAGPAAIGALASILTLPTALVLPAVLAAVVAVTARRALES
ncbi:MFS transporter [Streptomyces sp. S1D4-20]|uniref:MFS transporter n=1 Tax=Streptomyces sp. S1D4-20 TaxID=2594462 RepID=UPI001F073ECA|nr:MFS transporter [Streptomyces sp. S1D4-20]